MLFVKFRIMVSCTEAKQRKDHHVRGGLATKIEKIKFGKEFVTMKRLESRVPKLWTHACRR